MVIHSRGNSGDYAIIEINHKKKKIKFLDSLTRKSFEKRNLLSGLFSSFYLLFLIIFIIIFSILFPFNLDETFVNIIIVFLYFLVFSLLWLLVFKNEKLINNLHFTEQWLFNDILKSKKYIKIVKIDSLVYEFPYEFQNKIMNYRVSGDFKKYIIKSKIDFKKYTQIKRFSNKKKQINNKEWGLWFYFEKIPKNGSLEITWV